jgi:hypothetical protein
LFEDLKQKRLSKHDLGKKNLKKNLIQLWKTFNDGCKKMVSYVPCGIYNEL